MVRPSVSESGRDGRQTRWDSHKEQRRREIIAAAIAIAQENEPGTEIHVQEIAERAGLSRTVVYRHFGDRVDLDRAVQTEILDDVWALLLPQMTLEGSVIEIIGRIITTYVDWAVAHPALHRLADHDTTAEPGPLEAGLDQIAGRITTLLLLALPQPESGDDLFGMAPDEFVALLDPLVYGIVGAAFSSVRRWISQPVRVLGPETVAGLVTQSIWFVIQGHAGSFGVRLEADMKAEDIAGLLVGTGNLPA
jgi:AcrR family transcriptional regulator